MSIQSLIEVLKNQGGQINKNWNNFKIDDKVLQELQNKVNQQINQDPIVPPVEENAAHVTISAQADTD